MYAEIDQERRRALSAFRADVASGGFPAPDEVVTAADAELTAFLDSIDD